MEEKIDRLENHFKIYKSDMQEVKNTLVIVSTALVGSNMNGNRGIIHLVDEVNKRLLKIENENILLQEALNNYKWSIRAIFTGAIGFFIWWFKR